MPLHDRATPRIPSGARVIAALAFALAVSTAAGESPGAATQSTQGCQAARDGLHALRQRSEWALIEIRAAERKAKALGEEFGIEFVQPYLVVLREQRRAIDAQMSAIGELGCTEK